MKYLTFFSVSSLWSQYVSYTHHNSCVKWVVDWLCFKCSLVTCAWRLLYCTGLRVLPLASLVYTGYSPNEWSTIPHHLHSVVATRHSTHSYNSFIHQTLTRAYCGPSPLCWVPGRTWGAKPIVGTTCSCTCWWTRRGWVGAKETGREEGMRHEEQHGMVEE